MLQSSCDYRIHKSIFEMFGIFKHIKLQLKFENSCQTLGNCILKIEIFQTAGLLRLIISYMKVIN